jgi:hypothetical protein
MLLITLALALTACGGAATGPSEAPAEDVAPATAGPLTEDYGDALTIRNQLLLGTIRLEGTPGAVTSAQAAELTSLWMAMKALTTSGTAATEEITALQNQIIASMTSEQLQAIAAMQLTNADSQAYYAEIGVATPSTPSPDATGTPGSMRDLSKDEREATKTALGTPVGTGSSSGRGTILLDNVIALLQDKAA